MITLFGAENGRLKALDGALTETGALPPETAAGVLWVDVLEPGPEEDARVKALFGVDIPTREDMDEIEVSSRLYVEDDAAFMTVLLPANTESDKHAILPVSFIVAGDRLITVRYHRPRAFDTFCQRAQKINVGCVDGLTILTALLDAVVDRIADILERAGQDVEVISKEVFHQNLAKAPKARDFQKILREIGQKADLVSGVRDSLATLQRMFGFLSHVTAKRKNDREAAKANIKTLMRDAASLIDHATFLSQKITFLLDATLGMVSIEQNAIIKIFSVAAVIFLPPTLVASIYGMNFVHMPELEWLNGYPYALGLMVLSAVVPYLFFKRRGWL